MSYIPGLKTKFNGKWNAQFQIAEFGIEHLSPVGKMLDAVERNYYESDYKSEIVGLYGGTVVFNFYTDKAEIAEYVNRLFVSAE